MYARLGLLRRLSVIRPETRFLTAPRHRRAIQFATKAMEEIPATSTTSPECPEVPGKADAATTCQGSATSNEPKQEQKEEKLPKLSANEFRIYNHMAETMNYYHNHFRQTWTLMYSACEANKRPANMSIRQFLSTGLQFCRQLTMHHDIEEAHFFPLLAKKMPAFRHEMEMKTAHKSIHDGLEKLEPWLEECKNGERELNLRELKVIMDSFGKILWQHLDEEVEQLGAENMRKFWTISEMQRMPM